MPLPRKRKVTINDPQETPPKKFRVAITGLVVEDPRGSVIRTRAGVAKAVREAYPEITDAQLQNASIVYTDWRAYICLTDHALDCLRREVLSSLID